MNMDVLFSSSSGEDDNEIDTRAINSSKTQENMVLLVNRRRLRETCALYTCTENFYAHQLLDISLTYVGVSIWCHMTDARGYERGSRVPCFSRSNGPRRGSPRYAHTLITPYITLVTSCFTKKTETEPILKRLKRLSKKL
ncbi:hypothetical protein NQ317_002579 [Molorchus minor]|uniref:Uncharacterized protein n=1 Tax=Molorchus minor TaxID=1323400 RepID=A0ABQ9JSW0_9CUCU|nr:hypothetical protein NQ317_002579 [Molorchus minor]